MSPYLFLFFPRHLLLDGVGDLLLGNPLTHPGLPYVLLDGLYFSEYRGQGLLSSTASRGDSCEVHNGTSLVSNWKPNFS